MARYNGPRLRIMRSLGVQLPGLSSKKWDERKAYPPGMHQGKQRKKLSVYGTQLREKQKLRFNYGMGEKQLRRFVDMSFQKRGNPGENLVQLLESRLDNVMFRAGYARTIIAARQLIVHGHVVVNGQRVDKPAFIVKKDHKINMSPKGAKFMHVVASLEQPALARPEWLGFDEGTKLTTIINNPSHESIPFPIEIGQVIEFYSK
ncbi:MAG: 30S ribosomal protein S4 [Chitinophagaceae bacterium]|nr:30S ribosomal protein S4 [Oligoflexus sp.]